MKTRKIFQDYIWSIGGAYKQAANRAHKQRIEACLQSA